MKSFAIILKSIALSLLLATSAYAADKVNINTAHKVMLARKYRNSVLCNVNALFKASFINHRKTISYKISRLVSYVKIEILAVCLN